MPRQSVTFRNPPLQETALSLQFEPLDELRSALLGVFWSECLRREYPVLEADAPPIDPQFELFGDAQVLAPRLPRLRIGGIPSLRLRAMNAARDRMVQVQNGRLIVNWLRADGRDYPRFSSTKSEMLRLKAALGRFTTEQNLGPLVMNQWEVTYVNQIRQGELWNATHDIASLFPGLLGPAGESGPGEMETLGGSWKYRLPGDAGRLHVDLTHGWSDQSSSAAQLLLLQLTARGPIGESDDAAFERGMNLGHESSVQTFDRILSAKARLAWEREE